MEATQYPSLEIAGFAQDVARQAGMLALESFRKPVPVETKADSSPVTEADRQTELFLRAAVSERFPHHAIWGEEFGGASEPECPLWVIDPIDGTRSFITGSPIWGTLLALFDGGKPRLGVIEMPALNERWVGQKETGSWFSDKNTAPKACHVRPCKNISEARFYTTSPRYFTTNERGAIEQICDKVDIARFGGDCYSYGMLALGQIDLVVETRLQPYDYLALVPIIEEAGGIITDWAGAPLGLRSDGRVIAAATPDLHAAALEMLKV
ncbi:histidinol-phosphatase [Roseinatronobacter alkalisoli]|uniref:Histidinol-phosphatase n=1 Tax=Roseinatronobacter alkalisoli TaxID=3028235 RepID=A0ABT5TFC7_9RHOB|nr:histidinol-phosphatase [Roseinatronobacter sp. HJB301]MDD7973824.1 histidinol-phosphatase [Roseinatronobacter sp. HJB301]